MGIVLSLFAVAEALQVILRKLTIGIKAPHANQRIEK